MSFPGAVTAMAVPVTAKANVVQARSVTDTDRRNGLRSNRVLSIEPFCDAPDDGRLLILSAYRGEGCSDL